MAASPDGSVYTGYGASGTGSNLYRYANGAFTQTAPAPPQDGYAAGGGVYGIYVPSPNAVYWLSAYFGQGFLPYVDVECGGGGGSATLCQPTVDEPTTMLVDASGTFWVGGSSFNGDGQIVTSTRSMGEFASTTIVQMVLGPGGGVWGAMQNFPQYSIAQFIAAGGSVSIAQQFSLPAGDSIGSLTYGGDGAFWFTDQPNNAIGRMDKTGKVTEFPLAASNALGPAWFGLWQIATACDGAVWFTESQIDKIGRVDGTGAIHEFAVPTPNAFPYAISSAQSSGSACKAPELWVGEQNASKLAAVKF